MRSRRKKPHPDFRDIDGILLLDKPLGLSSNAALQRARRLVGAAKGGHTGSLDPLATGLLPLCFGEATKLAGSLLGSRKAYLAHCRLGTTTTTADGEGEIVLERSVPLLGNDALEAALAPLRGRIVQVPPVYSAIKVDGEALYHKARRGEQIQVPSRDVDIYRLHLLARHGDTLVLHVECGAGTYIRSLAVDLGERLGCGAHLTALRRLWVEPFGEPAMVTIEQLEHAQTQGAAALMAHVLPVAAGLADLPSIRLDALQSQAIAQGQKIMMNRAPMPVGRCAAFADDGRLLATVELDAQARVTIVRGFNLAVP